MHSSEYAKRCREIIDLSNELVGLGVPLSISPDGGTIRSAPITMWYRSGIFDHIYTGKKSPFAVRGSMFQRIAERVLGLLRCTTVGIFLYYLLIQMTNGMYLVK